MSRLSTEATERGTVVLAVSGSVGRHVVATAEGTHMRRSASVGGCVPCGGAVSVRARAVASKIPAMIQGN